MQTPTSKPGRITFHLATLGILAYGGAALVTVFDVVGRRFDLPIQGVVDLVQLCVMTGTWLVMPYAFYSGAHVSVDFIVERLPVPARTVCGIAGLIITVLLLGLMLWYSLHTAKLQLLFGDKSQELGIPILWYWIPVLFGMACSLITSVWMIFNHNRVAQ